jgi:putative ABC transport system permease protein
MTWRAWTARLRHLVSRSRDDRELDAELRLHWDLLTEEYQRQGMPRDDARRQAALTLGGLEQAKELVRETRGVPSLEASVRDIAHAIRALRKAPAFSAVTVVTLALGIAVNVAIFSIVDAVVLRPLPYPDSPRLISIWEVNDGGRMVVAPGNLEDYRRAASFADVAGLRATTRTLTGAEQPETLLAEEVTHSYLSVLGVHPMLGRSFTPSDADPTSVKVVILSEGLWQRRFGGNPAILGETVMLDGVAHVVIGVMPDGFRGVFDLITPERRSLWLPAAYPPEVLANRADHEIRVVARLADSASVDAARAELSAISQALADTYPATNANVRAEMQPLRDDVVRNVRTSLVVLLLTVGVILTVACVNVANLFLVRGVGRRREIALRFALGASRTRVVMSLIAESVVLATFAAVAGVVLANWMGQALIAAAPQDIPRLEAVSMNGRVLAYTGLVALATAVLFGIIPAWQAGHARPLDALAGGGRVIANAAVMRWRNALMVAQIALCALLLVGAGLMVKSLMRLNRVPLGFDPSRVIAMRIILPETRYRDGDARLQFFERLAERVASMPGVHAVGYANTLPLRGGWSSGFGIEGLALPRDGFFVSDFQAVSPGYFETLGIRVAEGRLLDRTDTKQTLPVAVVSRLFEERHLSGASAIGRQIRRGPKMPAITIVGVVDDVRRDGRRSELNPQVYLPAAQTNIYPVRLADLAIRTDASVSSVAASVRAVISTIDPEQSVSNIRALDDLLVAGSASQRFQALLFSLFALLALVLASVGTYGVVSYVVTQRTPEIGVRLALGASVWGIYRWLLGRTATVVIAGALAGLAAALAAGRYVSSLLFEVSASDPASYAAAAGLLVVVALIASVLAGHRATRIDPTRALRYE